MLIMTNMKVVHINKQKPDEEFATMILEIMKANKKKRLEKKLKRKYENTQSGKHSKLSPDK